MKRYYVVDEQFYNEHKDVVIESEFIPFLKMENGSYAVPFEISQNKNLAIYLIGITNIQQLSEVDF